MSPIDVYAIALAGVLGALILFKAVTSCKHALRHRRLFSIVNILSGNVFSSERWPSCTWSTVVWQLLLISSNSLLIFLRMTDTKSAARDAGKVALLDMAVFYLGHHLSSVADLLGVSLRTMKSIHRNMTLPFVLTVTFHLVVLRPSRPVFTTPLSPQLYGVIVGETYFVPSKND